MLHLLRKAWSALVARFAVPADEDFGYRFPSIDFKAPRDLPFVEERNVRKRRDRGADQ